MLSKQDAIDAMVVANAFMRRISTHGGYAWEYSLDLTRRWGEGSDPIPNTQIWVQSPGTPGVGQAMLTGAVRTGHKDMLQGAIEAASALAFGQLRSGGWRHNIDFAEDQLRNWDYRHTVNPHGWGRFDSTFDDGGSQRALMFLMRLDRETDGHLREVGETVAYALERFLEAQYPNGGWPQYFTRPKPADETPVLPAAYHADLPAKQPAGHDYAAFYTLNDGLMYDMVRCLALAHEVYGGDRFLLAICRAGAFLILAQHPSGAWAQQYDFDLRPAWARPFEPPALASAETLSAVRTLLDIYTVTGNPVVRVAASRGINWLESCKRIGDDKLARFYGLSDAEPVYVNTDGEVTSDPGAVNSTYGWSLSINLDAERKRLERADVNRSAYLRNGTLFDYTVYQVDPAAAQEVVDRLDFLGRWVASERIKTADFVANMDVLARFVATSE